MEFRFSLRWANHSVNSAAIRRGLYVYRIEFSSWLGHSMVPSKLFPVEIWILLITHHPGWVALWPANKVRTAVWANRCQSRTARLFVPSFHQSFTNVFGDETFSTDEGMSRVAYGVRVQICPKLVSDFACSCHGCTDCIEHNEFDNQFKVFQLTTS